MQEALTGYCAGAGVGMKHLTGDIKKSMGKVLAVDQNHYPEMLGRTCIINAPGFFKMIFGIVKPMLDARTQGKIEVLLLNHGTQTPLHQRCLAPHFLAAAAAAAAAPHSSVPISASACCCAGPAATLSARQPWPSSLSLAAALLQHLHAQPPVDQPAGMIAPVP